MNPIDELAALELAEALEWQCAAPGLRIGTDNRVDAVVTVHALRAIRQVQPQASAQQAETHAPAMATGLRDLRLRVSLARGVRLQALSRVEATPNGISLPALRVDQTLSLALRLHVPAQREQHLHRMVPLARATLQGQVVGDDGRALSPIALRLRMGAAVLRDDEYDDFPPDADTDALLKQLANRPLAPQPAATAANPLDLH